MKKIKQHIIRILAIKLYSPFFIIFPLSMMLITCKKNESLTPTNIILQIEKYENGNIKAKGAKINDKAEGYWVHYSENGIISWEEIYVNGKLNGTCNSYFENGDLSAKGYMLNDVREGVWIYYYHNGKIKMSGNMKDGKPDGTWKKYDENGRLLQKKTY